MIIADRLIHILQSANLIFDEHTAQDSAAYDFFVPELSDLVKLRRIFYRHHHAESA